MMTAEEMQNDTPLWVRGVSIPSALLGLVAFFLPWLEISCGPVHLRFTGYEFATGRWEMKLEPSASNDFLARAERESRPQGGQSSPARPTPNTQRASLARGDQSRPSLWIVPGACVVLVLLGVFGLPRLPTAVVALAAAASLAYFGITFEQEASDPHNTGGILESKWLFGYWACWVGLAVPFIVALMRPRRE